MTENEAIDWLKGMQNKPMDYAAMVGAPAFAYGYKFVYPDPEDYAIDEAINALEKQISQKPIQDSYCGFVTYECPKCHSEVKNGQKYCDDCGQKLDWSDEE